MSRRLSSVWLMKRKPRFGMNYQVKRNGFTLTLQSTEEGHGKMAEVMPGEIWREMHNTAEVIEYIIEEVRDEEVEDHRPGAV